MSKESRIGIFAALAIAILVIGYQYLKGKNVFDRSTLVYAVYDNVEQLTSSDPVYLNGVPVGIVSDVSFNPADLSEVRVTYSLNSELNIPKTTVAKIASASLMGGKMVILEPNGTCSGADCAQSGDEIVGGKQGLFDAFLGSDGESSEATGPADLIKDNLGDIMDTVLYSLGDPQAEHAVAGSFQRLEKILENLEKTTQKLDRLMGRSSSKLDNTLGNVESITGNLAASNDELTTTLKNFNAFSSNLKDADVAGMMDQAKNTLSTSETSIAAMEKTLETTQATLKNLTATLESVNKGEGTLGKMMKDDELYDNMLRTSKNLDLLLQDFRLNPKRYVNVSVFGKKQKKYEVPEDDPAFQGDEEE